MQDPNRRYVFLADANGQRALVRILSKRRARVVWSNFLLHLGARVKLPADVESWETAAWRVDRARLTSLLSPEQLWVKYYGAYMAYSIYADERVKNVRPDGARLQPDANLVAMLPGAA